MSLVCLGTVHGPIHNRMYAWSCMRTNFVLHVHMVQGHAWMLEHECWLARFCLNRCFEIFIKHAGGCPKASTVQCASAGKEARATAADMESEDQKLVFNVYIP